MALVQSTEMTSAASATTTVGEEYVGASIPYHTRIIFIIIGILYIIVGVVGNILIIVTILITKTMRNPHFYFIINLALGDLLITSYVIPNLVISFILGYYPVVNSSHCVFNGFIIVCAYVSSLLSLMVISVNRYLSVCHNQLFSRIFSNKIVSSVAGCAIIWFLAILSTLPCLFGWGRFVFDRKTHYCGYDRTFSFSYTLFLLLFSIGIPVVVVFFCNFAIWRFVRQASHRIYAMNRVNKRDHQVTSMESSKASGLAYTNNSSCIRIITNEVENENYQGGVGTNIPDSYDNNVVDSNRTGVDSNRSGEDSNRCDADSNRTCRHINETRSVNDNLDRHLQSENQIQFPNNQMKDEIQYLKPWDGTNHLIGLEIQEMKKEVKADGGHREESSKRHTSDSFENQRQKILARNSLGVNANTKGPSLGTRHRLEPQVSSGVLVTPDELALIKTVFVIFLAFAVFMMPYMMSTLLDVDDQWSAVTHITCSFTSFTNSCLNCILYGLMTPAFKKAYKKLLPCFRQDTLTTSLGVPVTSRGGLINKTNSHTGVTTLILGPSGGPSTQSTA